MTQNQVNRAVAKATGESVGTIGQMGFSVADPDHVSRSCGKGTKA